MKSFITGSHVHDLSGHFSPVTCLATSPDSNYLYVGCTDGHVYVYDIKSRALLATLIEQESAINDLKVSADNSYLFSSAEARRRIKPMLFLYPQLETNLIFSSPK